MVVILQKMIMTGAMCVVAQGSSVQLLIAILVMLMYMLLGKKNLFCLYNGCFFCSELFVFLSFFFLAVLKTAPFEADSEDWSAFVACVALTLTTIGGFALIMDDPATRTYESAVLAVILIGINVLCIVIEILIVVVVDCGTYERCTGGNGDGDSNDTKTLKAPNKSKVLPITNLSTWEA